MPNIQALQRRIKTATNIKQITKAMEMVSASKMRRAQAQALASRPYARKLQKTLQTIAMLTDPSQHPLLQPHEEGKDVIVLISTDKSLAGSLNTNLFRGTMEILPDIAGEETVFVIIGQKARPFAVSSGYDLYAEFVNLPDPIRYQDIMPLAEMFIQGYLSLEFRSVHLIYMDFQSTLVQKVASLQLLPFPTDWEQMVEGAYEAVESPVKEKTTYIFEPDAKSILSWILPYYVEMTLYQTMLESRASEHSARMVSMKNASENAGEIISDLTLTYNKTRQAKITTEILDNITSSAIVG